MLLHPRLAGRPTGHRSKVTKTSIKNAQHKVTGFNIARSRYGWPFDRFAYADTSFRPKLIIFSHVLPTHLHVNRGSGPTTIENSANLFSKAILRVPAGTGNARIWASQGTLPHNTAGGNLIGFHCKHYISLTIDLTPKIFGFTLKGLTLIDVLLCSKPNLESS